MSTICEIRPSKIGKVQIVDNQSVSVGSRKILKLSDCNPQLKSAKLPVLEKFGVANKIGKGGSVIDKLKIFKDFNMRVILESNAVEVYSNCSKCKIKFKEINNCLVCIKCAREKELARHAEIGYMGVGSDYNTSDTSFMPFRFTGQDSARYHKTLLKSSSNYSLYSKNSNIKNLQRYNDQYKGKKVPKFAIVIAIDLFCKIKQYRIFRNNGKRGVIGGCLIQACLGLGIPRTPREIAALLNIEEKFLSQGNGIIEEMSEIGRVELIYKDPLRGYIEQFLVSLEIDEKHADFLVELIQKANSKKITENKDCRPTTKCAGAIYFLSERLRLEVTMEDISKVCDVTRNTFDKYYKLLHKKGNLLRNVFKKHRIPMDKKWKRVSCNTEKLKNETTIK
jgi:transcription initiation factor TFIIIB Brf1 subunit/transcription initiation factor TFIIB